MTDINTEIMAQLKAKMAEEFSLAAMLGERFQKLERGDDIEIVEASPSTIISAGFGAKLEIATCLQAAMERLENQTSQEQDFDLSQLSSEQQAALEMFGGQTEGNQDDLGKDDPHALSLEIFNEMIKIGTSDLSDEGSKRKFDGVVDATVDAMVEYYKSITEYHESQGVQTTDADSFFQESIKTTEDHIGWLKERNALSDDEILNGEINGDKRSTEIRMPLQAYLGAFAPHIKLPKLQN